VIATDERRKVFAVPLCGERVHTGYPARRGAVYGGL
jgi:hypothetical protein